MESHNGETCWSLEFNFPASPDALLSSSLLTLPYSPPFTVTSPPCYSSCHGHSEPACENGVCEGDDDNEKVNSLSFPDLGLTPLDNVDVSSIIKERMTQALRYYKDSTEQNQILAQIWAPVKSGNNYVLTTSGQPFILGSHSNGLNQYRTVSLMYMYSVDGESVTTLGLPGRVFRQKFPEWTPNVQYYSSKEYPPVNHAKHYNVRGTLALPVLEPTRKSCIGVLELIMTSQKINYAPEVDKICKALEAVNLRSSMIFDHPNIPICNEGQQNALAEILEVLTEICETYKLPLAQTWIPCRHMSVLAYGGGLKKRCSSFDGSCIGQVCMSTTKVAFYVVDAHMWGFREACAEHHLQKGQGVAGRSFSSHSLSFCRDISQLCKIEYPLVHYARIFGLTGSFAICLRNQHDDYVLEFFLPLNLTDSVEQLNLLDSILAKMKHNLQNLMVASGKTFEEEKKYMDIVEVSMDENLDLQFDYSLLTSPLQVEETISGVISMQDNSLAQVLKTDASNAGKRGVEFGRIKCVKEIDGTPSWTFQAQPAVPVDMAPILAEMETETCFFDEERDLGGERNLQHLETRRMELASESTNARADRKLNMLDIVPWFSLKLVDAAKELGVLSRSTLKRKCRQLKIDRWPSSRKKNSSKFKDKQVLNSQNKLCLMKSSVPASLVCEEQNPKHLQASRHSSSSARQDGASNIFIVKAQYKEDFIRFNFSTTSSVAHLKEEVGKRLNLNSNTFKMKYRDDDNDYVLITCDSDLQDFLGNSGLSKNKTVRLWICDAI